jgi:hypothetical protein
MALVFLPLFASSVAGVGDAPLALQGVVVRGGVPVAAEVELRAFVDESLVAVAPPVSTDEEGLFFSVLTVDDGAVVDVQVTVDDGDVFVSLIEDASAWGRYEVSLDLVDDSLVVPAAESGIVAPGDPSLDDDLRRLRESGGDAADVVEKYGLDV